MPKYTVTFNVKLDEQLTVSIDANNQLDASDAADVIAYEIVSDPGFLVSSLQLECISVEAETPSYTPLTSPGVNSSTTHHDDGQYTSLASLYAQRSETCTPCQRNPSLTSSYTRLT